MIWSDWDGSRIEVFDETEEGHKKAQDFILGLRDTDNGTALGKVILGEEMEIEDVKIVSEIRLVTK